MQEENIQFDEMPLFGNIFQPQPQNSEIRERVYENLYDELTARCWPENYMNPYDTERVAISNQLYSKILQAKNDEEKLNSLRREATDLLGVKFNGGKLYEKLMKYFNPREYLRPYNAEYLEIANKYYLHIEENKDDYVALETIANEQEVIDFIEKLDRKQREREAFIERENNIQHRNANEYTAGEIYDIQNNVGDNWHEYINNEE